MSLIIETMQVNASVSFLSSCRHLWRQTLEAVLTTAIIFLTRGSFSYVYQFSKFKNWYLHRRMSLSSGKSWLSSEQLQVSVVTGDDMTTKKKHCYRHRVYAIQHTTCLTWILKFLGKSDFAVMSQALLAYGSICRQDWAFLTNQLSSLKG